MSTNKKQTPNQNPPESLEPEPDAVAASATPSAGRQTTSPPPNSNQQNSPRPASPATNANPIVQQAPGQRPLQLHGQHGTVPSTSPQSRPKTSQSPQSSGSNRSSPAVTRANSATSCTSSASNSSTSTRSTQATIQQISSYLSGKGPAHPNKRSGSPAKGHRKQLSPPPPSTASTGASVPPSTPIARPVYQEVQKPAKIQREQDVDRIRNSLNTPEDFKIIAHPPFSDMSRITDEVYLTGIFGLTVEKFNSHKINYVINATIETPLLRGIDCYRIPVDDAITEDISPFLDEAADRMNTVIEGGGRVVVHCMAGVSRSTAVVIAYLIKYKKMTLRQAYGMCARVRNVARPNSTFLKALIDFEMRHLKTRSTRIIRIKRNGIIIELPNFLKEDFPQKYEEEFSNNRAMNRVKEDEVQTSSSEIFDDDQLEVALTPIEVKKSPQVKAAEPLKPQPQPQPPVQQTIRNRPPVSWAVQHKPPEIPKPRTPLRPPAPRQLITYRPAMPPRPQLLHRPPDPVHQPQRLPPHSTRAPLTQPPVRSPVPVRPMTRSPPYRPMGPMGYRPYPQQLVPVARASVRPPTPPKPITDAGKGVTSPAKRVKSPKAKRKVSPNKVAVDGVVSPDKAATDSAGNSTPSMSAAEEEESMDDGGEYHVPQRSDSNTSSEIANEAPNGEHQDNDSLPLTKKKEGSKSDKEKKK